VAVSRAIYLGPIRVDMTTRDGIRSPAPASSLVRAIRAAAVAAGAPLPASVGLVLSGDAELAGLNATHLGVAGATDVLSFPLLPPESFPRHPGGPAHHAGGPDRLTGATTAFRLPPGRRPSLGDIVVSVERATDQAIQGHGGQTGAVRWSPADELRLLVTHGTLHLCGWDHAEPAEEAAMRALEAALLGSG